MPRYLTIILCVFLTANPSWAAGGHMSLPSAELSLVWVLPFIGILLSLAIAPLAVPSFWHHHYGKVSLLFGMLTVVPVAFMYGYQVALYEVLHTYLLEYIPFILVATVLYTVSGGIKIKVASSGSPRDNLFYMLFATFVASWIGTTGAAMLFIRPLLVMNKWRVHKSHIVLFFILLVCNLGGSLTALGDPPLFLGFLKGVPFFWPFIHMLDPLLIVLIPVIILFALFDTYYYRKEDLSTRPAHDGLENKIQGKVNFFLLLCVVGSVILSGNWKPGVSFNVYGIDVELQNLVRDITFVAITFISLWVTPKVVREYNQFDFEPIKEVAKLFAAIFITAMPAISILSAGKDGALGPLVSLVTTPDGQPVNDMYFWLTGMLSAFLDNAPTYLVFFSLAGGDAQVLSTTASQTLTAISAGAVFMGALTYIGNAPNFLIKSIAEVNDIEMPSFFGYMFRAAAILIPCFILLSYLRF